MRVEKQDKAVVDNRPAPGVGLVNCVAAEIDAQAPGEIVFPFLLRHLGAVGLEPRNVLAATAALQRAALKEMAAMEHGMLATERDQALYEFEQARAGFVQAPVDP